MISPKCWSAQDSVQPNPLLTTAWIATLCALSVTCGSSLATAQEVTPSQQAEITSAIKQLKSAKFRERQSAFQSLVDARDKALVALEAAAKSDDTETVARSIEILAVLATDPRTSVAAIAALDRIAKTDRRLSVAKAKAALAKVKVTDKQRAISLLQGSGAQITGGNGGPISVTVTSDAQLAVLKDLGSVAMVTISGKAVSDDGIRHLAKVKGLRAVTILESTITGVGIGRFNDLLEMNMLALADQGVAYRADDLRQLKKATQLRTLRVSDGIRNFKFLSDLKQLATLTLGAVVLTRDDVDFFNNRKNIQRFNFTLRAPNDAQIALASEIKLPTMLNIQSDKISAAGWRHLREANLVGLKLSNSSITDDGLKHISAIKTLTFLTIQQASITDAGLAHLANLKALSMFWIRNAKTTDAGLLKLQNAKPNLKIVGAPWPAFFDIRFSHNPQGGMDAYVTRRLTAANIARLKRQPNLNTIKLSDTSTDEDLQLLRSVKFRGLLIQSRRISDAGIRALENHKTLEHLDIWDSRITNAALDSIGTMPKLARLAISKANITDEGLQRLIPKLGKRNQLTSISLDICPRVTAAGFKDIDQLARLEKLVLGKIDGFESGILSKIGKLAPLQVLSLDELKLVEKDLEHLTGLKRLETLRLTGLADSKSANEGVSIVCRIASLKKLTLTSPGITSECASELTQLEHLEHLGLQNTSLSDDGLATIAKNHPGLVSLDLRGANITDASMPSVAKLTRLQHLNLSGTEVSDAGLRQLDNLNRLKSAMASGKNITSHGQRQFQRRDHAAVLRGR